MLKTFLPKLKMRIGGGESIFDNITKDDLIMAFFPCIEFSCVAQMWYSLNQRDYEKWSYKKRIDYMIEKNNSRANMFNLLNKMCGVCLDRGFRLIFENPYGINTYLKTTVFLKNHLLLTTIEHCVVITWLSRRHTGFLIVSRQMDIHSSRKIKVK